MPEGNAPAAAHPWSHESLSHGIYAAFTPSPSGQRRDDRSSEGLTAFLLCKPAGPLSDSGFTQTG